MLLGEVFMHFWARVTRILGVIDDNFATLTAAFD